MTENLDRLKTDARAVLAALEHEIWLSGKCSLVVHLAASFTRDGWICGVIMYSDGRSGLSARAEEALRGRGWHVQYGPDVYSEIRLTTKEMTAHERLKAIALGQSSSG